LPTPSRAAGSAHLSLRELHQKGWSQNMRNHGEQRRALRYPLELPIEVDGATGRTRDFSSSGVFFETDRALAPGAPIEFSLVVGHVSSGGPLRLDCEGRVVRTAPRDGQLGVAVAITRCR